MHPFGGLALDAQLYAVQALAKLHPALGTDLYFQNGSQDRFTIFSGIYAAAIRVLGLQRAELSIYLACIAVFYAGAWLIARRFAGTGAAFLVVVLLLSTGGIYGAAHVFHFSEDFLTARSVAESLIMAALVCHVYGHKAVGVLVALAALLFHPLMALPGLLLLACLTLPVRIGLLAAVAGVLAAVTVAAAPVFIPALGKTIVLMDPDWLSIVRERAQFLFLQLWTMQDWEVNVRPFLSLLFTFMASRDAAVRKLCFSAALVGVAGLAVAAIAGGVGPAAILLQGQAWRWVWITGMVSILLLGSIVERVWLDEKCGPLCVVLLIAAWTFESADGLLCLAVPCVLWRIRHHTTLRIARLLRWTALVVVLAIVAWVIATSSTILSTPVAESGYEPAALSKVRYILQLNVSAVVIAVGLWQLGRSARSYVWPAVSSVLLIACVAVILPWSLTPASRVGSTSEIEEFSDWRSAIPPTSTVYVSPQKDAGAFVWFTLGRPNYSSSSQSAGVVFSRATALEVRRRADVLLPLADPEWKIMTRLSRTAAERRKDPPAFRSLTAKNLLSVCTDPLLGFVMSPQDVGFGPLKHPHPGIWKNWNLYDCGRIRALGTTS